MKRIILTLVLAIAAGIWNFNWASGGQISSLCDEWNVLMSTEPTYYDLYGGDTILPRYKTLSSQTRHYYLKDDTTINSTLYTKAFYENEYIGALRESEDTSKIFGIPVNHTHEYLLYDWSAQVGDTLQNVWLGEDLQQHFDSTNVVVRSIIKGLYAREFTFQAFGYLNNGNGDSELYTYYYTIIEGVGMSDGAPIIHSSIEEGTQSLLCAYKNGEQVYTSLKGKKLGCSFDSRQITDLLKGKWRVYKQRRTTTGSAPKNEEIEYEEDDFFYSFTDASVQMICPTCNSTPKFYGVEPKQIYDDGRVYADMWVKDVYGALRSNDKIIPFSSIAIQYITRNNIEWYFQGRLGENKSVMHYQYLRRYSEEVADTIPLFVNDGPGSSTVEPVDPNLIYAILAEDILSIYTTKDKEINFTLYKAPAANHMPAVKHTIKSTTFTDSISTTITEPGTYTIELTNPAWDYTIVGTFDYLLPQAVETTPADTPKTTKILKDGQLIFLYQGKTYNVQGQQVQ